MGISFPYWPGYREMITRPIWKCPCIKLFITYFRHLEKRRPYWPETEVDAHIGPGQYGLRYGNDLVVIQ